MLIIKGLLCLCVFLQSLVDLPQLRQLALEDCHAFREHSGNVQCTFREHSVHVQGTFSA